LAPNWLHTQPSGCGCLAPLFSPVPPGAHWPQEKGLTGNHQILGFLDVRDVLSSFLAGWCAGISCSSSNSSSTGVAG
jgi:hypothetical protein